MRSLLLPCLVCLALGNTACGDAIDEPTGVGGAELNTTIQGVYTVPVTQDRLTSQATFPVSVKVKTLANGVMRLHYDLPVELVGSVQTVDIRGPSSALSGAIGTGQCTNTGAQTVCHEQLSGVVVDLAGVADALDANQVSPVARAAALDVAATFASDPIGILSFPRSTRDGNNNGSGNSGRHGER